MTPDVARSCLERIYSYARRQGLPAVGLVLHGGEPLLAGKQWLKWFLDEVARLAPAELRVAVSLQTNGILLDADWLSMLGENNVSLGVSIDGPPELHDRHRVDFRGRGTYREVRRGIDLLVEAGSDAPAWGVLVVANPEFSATRIYHHLVEIGVQRMDFIWPDFHHDMPPPWPPESLADYYTGLFDAWYDGKDANIKIRWFEVAMEMILGSTPRIDALGPQALTEVVVETDGSLEPLDVLRMCGDGMTQLGLDVLTNDVEDLRATELFRQGIQNQELLPTGCLECPVYSVCGGGYMPHRWGRERGFRNPSVHCDALIRVLSHITRRVRGDLLDAFEGRSLPGYLLPPSGLAPATL